MSSEFHQTQMGTRFFNKQLPELTRALGRLADTLASVTGPRTSLESTCTPEFFRAIMDGEWDVFQELSTPAGSQYREKHEKVLALEEQLRAMLGEQDRPLLEQYQEALMAEEPEELEHAFLVGYQTAMKLILMGVTPITTIAQQRKEQDS